MPALDHVHMYARYDKEKGQYHCLDPKCYHLIDKKRLVGKASLCTSCKAEFILTPYNLKHARPRCLNCAETREAKEYQRAKDIMNGMSNIFDPKGEGGGI